MDPEQIYQEVLQEEQQKGSAAPVAEGRAKAARARAEHGSPHPKEPKWWPGAQPHLEADGAAPQATAEVDEAPAEEPRVEAEAGNEAASAAPAATEEQQQPVVESDAPLAPAEPAPVHPAPQPAEPVPVAAAPAAAAPAAVATAPATAPVTTGVTHGVSTGTRLRPEDEVSTEAQFDGQRAMYERRRLIDEVIQTGVPATAAARSERSGSAALAILYLLIPLAVILFLASNRPDATGATEGTETGTEQTEGGDVPANTIVAVDTSFETDTLEAPAGKEVTYTLDNRDEGVPHNWAVYDSEDAVAAGEDPLFASPDTTGPESVDFSFTPPKKPGDYPYICDFHPTTMTGTLTVTK